MKQRVALARALATDPEILLMDEPLRQPRRADPRAHADRADAHLGRSARGVVLFVTHSVDEAILLSDQIVLMGPRPGRIVETLDVDLPRPRWDYDVRARPDYLAIRKHLWSRLRDMVMTDPESDFYQARAPAAPRSGHETDRPHRAADDDAADGCGSLPGDRLRLLGRRADARRLGVERLPRPSRSLAPR